MCFGMNIVGSVFSTGSKSAPDPAPITSANQQRQSADTDAQVAANESLAARRKKSTSLLATGSPSGVTNDGAGGSVLATGKTQLGQ